MAEYTVEQLILGHEKAFVPERAGNTDAVVQYHLTGEQGGDWVITIRNGVCKVAAGVTANPTLTLIAEGLVFRDILMGRMDGMAALMQGKLQLKGNLGLAMKLIGFFDLQRGI